MNIIDDNVALFSLKTCFSVKLNEHVTANLHSVLFPNNKGENCPLLTTTLSLFFSVNLDIWNVQAHRQVYLLQTSHEGHAPWFHSWKYCGIDDVQGDLDSMCVAQNVFYVHDNKKHIV